MRSFLVLCAMVFAVVCAMPTERSNYVKMFEDFKVKHGRKYASTVEESRALRSFVMNMKKAEKLSKMNPLATFGVNEFSDMSAAEFKIRHSAEKHFKAQAASRKEVAPLFTAEQIKAAPSSIDWRTKGAVTYVKNQGQCGSCWSFSSTGSIEGQWFLAGHTLVALSEQELVSCDTTDNGCNGGVMDNAWAWLVSNQHGNIATEASYPYVSGGGNVPACALPKTTGATISGHLNVASNEDQMAAWVGVNGPLSIGVDATSWQTYTSGIMTNCISSQVDHGVLIVGYDNSNSPPYWIIKNSWAASWGENGYIRVEKGTDQCLITSSPCSSQVAAGPGPKPTPGPGPNPTPSPPSPPTPTGAEFTQYVCTDFLCLSGCQSHSFQQDVCLPTTGGASAKVVCSGSELVIHSYTTTDCRGTSKETKEPVDQCLADTTGTYVYNTCGGASSSGSSAGGNTAEKMHLPKH